MRYTKTLLKKEKTITGVLALAVLLLLPAQSKAQLVVNWNTTPAQLMAAFIGSGLTTSNVVLNCPSVANGTFSNGNTTNLGINNGAIFTTGSVASAVGPNNSTSAGFCSNGGPLTPDPQLAAIEPMAVYDPCILEFDIVPQCNQLTLSFVFGSDEYPEFVGLSFNDAFGFFITGPGPNCQAGFYNNTNVATLPNNITPASIDNINNGPANAGPCNNCAYYVDNTGGTTLQYDGLTTVLTRTITLCACSTYHFKIAIADAGDCIYDSGVFIDFLTCGSSALTATASSTPSVCTGATGTATVTASGQGPFTYSWAPMGGNAATATGLPPGTYTVTVDDAVSCSPPITLTVTVGSSNPSITLATTATDLTCNGSNNGSASTVPSGGNGPYTYSWAPGGATTATVNNLAPGTYTVTVTDASGCSVIDTVTISSPTALVLATNTQSANCSLADGSASVTATGGTSPYSYAWSSGGTGATENNLAAGTYTVVVTDANGCSLTTSVSVTSQGGVTLTALPPADVTCYNACDGSASVQVSSGTGPFTYNWSPSGGNGTTAASLCAGSYSCVVTDPGGCTDTITVSITQPPQLTLAVASAVSICTGNTASLGVTASGGTPAYTISWNPGNLTGANPVVSPASTTTYTVIVTDANLCADTATQTITVGAIPLAGFIADDTSGCSPLCVNFTDLSTIASPDAITSWSWDFGDGGTSTAANPNYCYNAPGVYTVSLTITSNNGCSGSYTVTNYISVAPSPIAAFSFSPEQASIYDPVIYFTDLSSGATQWLWNFGDDSMSTSTLQNPAFPYPDTGCYTVTLSVTNSGGCTDDTTAEVCILPDWSLYVPNSFTPNGDGTNDGFRPYGEGIDPENYQLWIFDRWGNLIFQTNDWYMSWDGRVQGGHSGDIAQIDTYVWKIRCKDILGNKHQYIGKVSLIR